MSCLSIDGTTAMVDQKKKLVCVFHAAIFIFGYHNLLLAKLATSIDFWIQAFMRLELHIMHGEVPKDTAFLQSLIIRALHLYLEN